MQPSTAPSELENPSAPTSMAGEAMGGEKGPFFPSAVRNPEGRALPAGAFLGPETCGTAGCHADIVREWQSSVHAHSSFDNPYYRRTVESMQEAWPKAHHLAPPDLSIRQRQLCSAVDRAHNLSRWRDEIGIDSDHFKGG